MKRCAMETKKKKTKSYESPAVFDCLSLELEQTILAGSVLDSLNSSGTRSQSQELEQIDASEMSFNHDWN